MPRFEVAISRCDTLRVVVEAPAEAEAREAGYDFLINVHDQDRFLTDCVAFEPVEASPVADDTPLSKEDPQTFIAVNERERDTILGALRYARLGGVLLMPDEEVDDLCARIEPELVEASNG